MSVKVARQMGMGGAKAVGLREAPPGSGTPRMRVGGGAGGGGGGAGKREPPLEAGKGPCDLGKEARRRNS